MILVKQIHVDSTENGVRIRGEGSLGKTCARKSEKLSWNAKTLCKKLVLQGESATMMLLMRNGGKDRRLSRNFYASCPGTHSDKQKTMSLAK